VRCTGQIQFYTPNYSPIRATHAGQFHNLLVDPRASLSFAPVWTHHLVETSATHAPHSSSVRRTDQIQFHTPNHSQVRASHAGQFRNLLVDPRASLSFAPLRTHYLAETSATHAPHSSSVRRTDQIQFHTPNYSLVRATHAGQFHNLLVDPRATLSFAPVRTHHLAETSATHAHYSSSVRRTDQIQFHTPNHSRSERRTRVNFVTYSSTRVRRSRLYQ